MTYISRRKLEAFGEPLGDSVTMPKAGGSRHGGWKTGGGGGGGPSSTTVTQSNVPDWLRPQVEGLLRATGQELFQTSTGGTGGAGDTFTITGPLAYEPYSDDPTQYVADFSPLQISAMNLAGGINEPYEFPEASKYLSFAAQRAHLAAGHADEIRKQLSKYGTDAANLASQAQSYGATGAGYGTDAANLASLAQEYGATAAGYGDTSAGFGSNLYDVISPLARGYGSTAAKIGGRGETLGSELGQNVSGRALDLARQTSNIGQLYENLATSPPDYERFMSPYMQQVVQRQQEDAITQAKIAEQSRKAAAARAGAFGGSRQAIESAEANKALQTQLAGIQAQGLQNAYQQAQQNIQQRAQLGLQGLLGAQQGLGTALQGGQLGLAGLGQAMQGQQIGLQGLGTDIESGRLNLAALNQAIQAQQAGMQGLGQAGQLYGLGMQGQQLGLQGLGQAGQLYGLGMQGQQLGLQGLGQAGQLYGLGIQGELGNLQGVDKFMTASQLQNQIAQTYGQIGQQRLGNVMNIINMRNQLGAQQQQREQAIINQAIQNYAMAQEMPFNRLAQFSAMLRGYAVPGQTVTSYQASPSPLSQIAGAGLGIAGLTGLMGKKEGGVIDSGGGVDRLALRKALKGE